MCENHLFKLKERGKKMGDSRSTNDLKPPFSMNEEERKLRKNVKFIYTYFVIQIGHIWLNY